MSDISIGNIQASVQLDLSQLSSGSQQAQAIITSTASAIQSQLTSITQNVTVNMRNITQSIEASNARAMAGINTLSNAFLGLGGAIGTALGDATKHAAEFDSALHEVAANAGLSADGMKEVHDGILAIAKDKNVHDAPTALAKGLYEVYSAGYKGDEALQILHEAALGAAAGITDTKTSASALLTVLQSGIKGVDGTRQAMDLLLKATEAGRIHFPELANNIAKVIAPAKSFGISIQDVLAALVSFTRQGQPVARATTDLVNLMGKLAHPSQASAAEFKKLGIEFGVNALKVHGLSGTMDDLIKRTKGHSDTLLKLFPELRAYRGAVEAAQNSGKSFHEILQTLSHATDGQGQTMKAVTKINEGAGQQYDLLKKQIATLETEIGEKLLPTFRKFMGQVSDLVKWFSSLSDRTKNNLLIIAEWGSGLLLAIGTIGKFAAALNSIRIAYLGIAGAAGIARAAQAGAAGGGVAGGVSAAVARNSAGAGAGVLAVGSKLPVIGTAIAAVGLGLMGNDAAQHSIEASEAQNKANALPDVSAYAARIQKLRTMLRADPSNDGLKKQVEETFALARKMLPNNPQEAAAKAAAKALADANAAVKADMDYAKKALAADPFPGAKDKKSKKSKEDKDPDMGDVIADHIKAATKSAPVSASCAFFVSEVLKQSGVAVKGSNSVKELWQQLIGIGAEEVTGGLKRGDILKFHGKNFGTSKDAEGKGNHTGIYNGDGTFTDSHEFNSRRSTRSLADYLKANPDADVHALRLGDKDDRTSKQIDNQNSAQEKASEKRKSALADEQGLFLAQMEERKGTLEAQKGLEDAIAADKRTGAADDIALGVAELEEMQRTHEYWDGIEADKAKKREEEKESIAADYEWQEQKFKQSYAEEVERQRALNQLREGDLGQKVDSAGSLGKSGLQSLLAQLRQLQDSTDDWQQKWGSLPEKINAVNARLQQMSRTLSQQIGTAWQGAMHTMADSAQNILGGALEKIFKGDTKNLFADMLNQFIQVLEQMVARAVAAGIVNLLTGGAGGFAGGFLGSFGFDDATNDTKAARWGFDWSRHFSGGVMDQLNTQKPFGNNGSRSAGGGDTHVTVNMHGTTIREDADVDRIASQIAWKMQSGLKGRYV